MRSRDAKVAADITGSNGSMKCAAARTMFIDVTTNATDVVSP